jgi:hypothetical protein
VLDHYARVRRAAFGPDVSVAVLTKEMVEVLLKLPDDAPLSKEGVVAHLGLLGALATTRDLTAAWNAAKRRVARDHPARFRLERNVLERGSAATPPPLPKLSAAGHRRLATLAAKEGLDPDRLLGRLIETWRGARR